MPVLAKQFLAFGLVVLSLASVAVAQGDFEDGWPADNDGGLWNHGVPWVGYSHDVGDGIGYPEGYSSFEGFVPIFGLAGQSLFFADLRLLVDKHGEVGGNMGLGLRAYDEDSDRIFGIFVYYDRRDTGHNEFEQLSIGFETLGETWDFRTNAYLPSTFDDDPQPIRGRSRFQGTSLLLATEAPMTGIDMELGIPLPLTTEFDAKVFGGGYYFDVKDHEEAFGWRTRIEAYISENVSVNLSVQDDQVFDTCLDRTQG